jgi:hypothetical protein
MKVRRGSRGRALNFFNLDVGWSEWSTPRSDRFTPGKTRYSLIGKAIPL